MTGRALYRVTARAALGVGLLPALAAAGGPARVATPAAAAGPARATHDAELRGVVELVDARGRRVNAGVENAVVWFVPAAGVAPPPPGRFEMLTRRKRFEPRVLVVPVGSRVHFPNRDPILHNVFSVSAGNAFDLGLLGEGEGGTARLDRPGVVRVFCNVHQSMIGYVAVVDTPFSTRPDVRGEFVLRGLPAGPGELLVWHERGEPLRRRVTAGGEVLRVRFEVVRPLVPPHLDKLGRPYARHSRDRY